MHRLDDNHAVEQTATDTTHIFATILEFGQITKDGYAGAVALDDDAMWELIKWFTDGKCPLCGNDINQGETICDGCFDQAEHYRERCMADDDL